MGSVGQSEWRDRAPHLESGFHFVPVVLRCGGKPGKLISSFPEGWKIKDKTDGENPATLREGGERACLMYSSQTVWRGPSCSRSLLLLCSEQQVKAAHIQPHPLGMCYDNRKRWTGRARSGMNRSQGFWHVGVGEKDLCWEVSSLKIQPSTQVPSSSHGKLSGPTSDCCAGWSKQIQLSLANGNS